MKKGYKGFHKEVSGTLTIKALKACSETNTIAVSNHLSDKPVDCLFIGESMIDCISHFQLKKKNL